MYSNKVWSLLLLLAMSFSLVHDLTLVEHHDQHSVKEYVGELVTSSQSVEFDFHDIHLQCHALYILPSKTISFQDIYKEEDLFVHNKIFQTRNSFNFFRPPIA